MYTIKNNSKYELIIKNSRFICLLYKVSNQEEIKLILEQTRNNYPDATHYCYAYIIDNHQKSSDDGEPSGTAGIPMLKVLENNNLTNTIAIIIRYFGGIKLGANGLIRAYTKVLANAIQENTIIELTEGYNLDITFNYDQTKEIDYLLKDIKINNKTFNNTITYNIDITKNFLNKLTNINYKIIKEILIEKK